MRAFVVSLFGLVNVVVSSPLHHACARLSRFSPRACEVMRLAGLLVVTVMLVRETVRSTEDRLPLLWTTALAFAVALARAPAALRVGVTCSAAGRTRSRGSGTRGHRG